jgi:hypothetical protein
MPQLKQKRQIKNPLKVVKLDKRSKTPAVNRE